MRVIELIIDDLTQQLRSLSFGPPVSWVYNPLEYARQAHIDYWRRYGNPPKRVVFLGMNPGPWGMVQTGVPFGDVGMVGGWLDLHPAIVPPVKQHPKRPVLGMQCRRGEVSGARLWGWAREKFGTPQRFFQHFWVANYCPLAFMEASGRNRTPDRLPKNEKNALLKVCDEALIRTMDWLQPEWVVGVGAFAARQAERALAVADIKIGRITHPSPASPKANLGWAPLIEQELQALGIELPDFTGK